MSVVFIDTIQPGLMDLSSRILGPNSVTQAALPCILFETPESYHDDIIYQLQVGDKMRLFFVLNLIKSI